MHITYHGNIFPLVAPLSDSMTDKEFFEFCQQNDSLQIERDENKQITIMAPTSASTGKKSGNIFLELGNWNRKKKGGVCFDSSTGFTLPDGSVRSPDASWMTLEKWDMLSEKEKNEFPHVCPDFVIELKSKSDNMKFLTAKMQKWIENGCCLAWMINPENKTAFIYRKGGTIEKITGFDKTLSGEKILSGFKLDLSLLI